MKKSAIILAIVLVLTFIVTLTASATKPEHVTGLVPLSSYNPGPEFEEYDVCDSWLVGHVVQPAAVPGFAIHGTFTAGDIPDIWGECEYTTTELEGTCELMLIPVEEFGNPESKKGRAVIGRCTDDLQGLHMRAVINFDFTYSAWYHMEH
jgi:hypothetical protein